MRKIWRSHAFEILVLGLVTLIIQIAVYFHQNKKVHSFQDPDCFMRMVRVEEWNRTGDWFDSKIPRSNAPYGETLHWTRPFDIVLMAGTKILQPFLGFRNALEFFSIIVSPLLQFVSVFALAWAIMPWFDRQNRLRFIILFLLQPSAFIPFLAGRPDHHSLLVLLFILEVGCFLRILSNEEKHFSYLLGFLLSLAMWVSVESLTVIAAILGTLGLLWLKNEKNISASISKITSSLFLFSFLFLLLDKHISDILTPEYDRISIVHIFIFALMATWGILIQKFYGHCEERSDEAISLGIKGNKLLFTIASIGIIAALILIVFPDFARGPYAKVDPRAVQAWLKEVKEVQPLWKLHQEPFFRILIWIGPAFVCVPFVILKLLRAKHNDLLENRLWIFTALGTFIFLSLSLYQIRWVYYSIIFLLIPLTILLDASIRKLRTKLSFPWFELTRAVTIILFAAGFFIVGIQWMLWKPNESSASSKSTKNEVSSNQPVSSRNRKIVLREVKTTPSPEDAIVEICDFLNQSPFAKNQRIATSINIGPEILYRTQNETIGSPYHRNGQGILFVNDLMTAKSHDEALKLVRERKVTLILLEVFSHYTDIYKREGVSFCYHLLYGNPPSWAKPIDLPENLQNSFKLFQIVE